MVAPLSHEYLREKVDVLRVERDGSAQVGFRFLGAPQRIENRAEVGLGLGVFGVLLYGDAGCVEGFLIPCLLVQSRAQVEVGLGVFGVLLYGDAGCVEGFLIPCLLVQGLA